MYNSLSELREYFLFQGGSKELFDFLLPMEEVLVARNEPLNNIHLLNAIYLRTKDKKEQFLLICFKYLGFAEEVFDQTIRALYQLGSWYHGTPQKLENARSLSLVPSPTRTQKKRELTLKGSLETYIGKEETAVLFEGYSPRLRNSIAHFDFKYDNTSKKMTFQDRFPVKGTPSAKALTLTLAELEGHCYKLVTVHNFVTNMLAHQMIYELVMKENIGLTS